MWLPRLLLAAALLQFLLLASPPLTWTLWLVHLAALETSFLGVLLALAAGFFTREVWLRRLGLLTALANALPGLSAIPVFVAEAQPFSLYRWLGGEAPARPDPEQIELVPGLHADLYPAEGPAPHGYVVVVHGGSWQRGDKGDAPWVSHALAAAGLVVVDVQYRLAPAFHFPAAIQDISCLLAAVQAQASAWGLDPERGALLGRSAGGQIALVSAYLPDSTILGGCVARPPRAVVSVYGPVDLAWAHGNPFVPDVVDGPAGLERYLGGTPAEQPEAYAAANPLTWVERAARPARRLPSTLLIHGMAERCVRPRNPEVLRDALQAGGHEVETLFIPWADHGFDMRRGGLGEQLARGRILEFLTRELGVTGEVSPGAPDTP